MLHQATNWSDGAKALRVLQKYLQESGKTLQTQARMLDEAKSKVVSLPGFSALPDGVLAPSWAVPESRRGLDEVISAYEAYADRSDLGVLPKPCGVARKVLSAGPTRQFFGGISRPSQWWTPAAKLIALASNLSRVPAKVWPHRVVLDLGDIRMEVTKRGCYSNFRGRVVQAKRAASDAYSELLDTGSTFTQHPLARALSLGNFPLEVLQAANSVVRSEGYGKLGAVTAESLNYPDRAKRGKGKNAFTAADVNGAILACREVLEMGEPGALPELYRYSVPILMPSSDFKEQMGSPWNSPHRKLSPTSVEKMHAILETYAKAA